MSNGIVLIVNLPGKLGKTIAKEQDIQIRHGEALLTKHITYLGKEETQCVRKTNVSGEVVNGWIGGKSPFFIKEFIWKNMSKTQRLKAWVDRFNEGFGVTFQEL